MSYVPIVWSNKCQSCAMFFLPIDCWTTDLTFCCSFSWIIPSIADICWYFFPSISHEKIPSRHVQKNLHPFTHRVPYLSSFMTTLPVTEFRVVPGRQKSQQLTPGFFTYQNGKHTSCRATKIPMVFVNWWEETWGKKIWFCIAVCKRDCSLHRLLKKGINVTWPCDSWRNGSESKRFRLGAISPHNELLTDLCWCNTWANPKKNAGICWESDVLFHVSRCFLVQLQPQEAWVVFTESPYRCWSLQNPAHLHLIPGDGNGRRFLFKALHPKWSGKKSKCRKYMFCNFVSLHEFTILTFLDWPFPEVYKTVTWHKTDHYKNCDLSQ